mmetsp:Transcript_43939/g.110063  ORF Transcript_43939/g.110063 Transcript_43939/m.110063 type:complete len:299 (+) Transcript_43939:436-1332(+)
MDDVRGAWPHDAGPRGGPRRRPGDDQTDGGPRCRDSRLWVPCTARHRHRSRRRHWIPLAEGPRRRHRPRPNVGRHRPQRDARGGGPALAHGAARHRRRHPRRHHRAHPPVGAAGDQEPHRHQRPVARAHRRRPSRGHRGVCRRWDAEAAEDIPPQDSRARPGEGHAWRRHGRGPRPRPCGSLLGWQPPARCLFGGALLLHRQPHTPRVGAPGQAHHEVDGHGLLLHHRRLRDPHQGALRRRRRGDLCPLLCRHHWQNRHRLLGVAVQHLRLFHGRLRHVCLGRVCLCRRHHRPSARSD